VIRAVTRNAPVIANRHCRIRNPGVHSPSAVSVMVTSGSWNTMPQATDMLYTNPSRYPSRIWELMLGVMNCCSTSTTSGTT
jgi:hypothetical protein